MITVEEFANQMKVSTQTVYKWIQMGLPVIKIDAVIRIEPNEALTWLREQK
jgi:excisionase family DNA binding protein